MKTQKKFVGLAMFDFLKGFGILLVLIRHSIYSLDISTDNPILQETKNTILIPKTTATWLSE